MLVMVQSGLQSNTVTGNHIRRDILILLYKGKFSVIKAEIYYIEDPN